ncbi:MAG TPA: ATP synthase F0 subunit B [Pyrinomonadaceae bacterium]|nr:ATP synthase F0 subunit B [Pyrinomonadaceae bacterium]
MFLLALAESPVQLVPDGSVIIHVALILLMIFILNRTFFRPINRILETREKNRGGRFGEAEGILQEVSEKQSKYNQAMLEARSEGYEMIEKERTAAVAKREAALTAVKAETAQKFASEKTELEQQTAQAKTAIAAEAEKMAEKISSNILRA